MCPTKGLKYHRKQVLEIGLMTGENAPGLIVWPDYDVQTVTQNVIRSFSHYQCFLNISLKSITF